MKLFVSLVLFISLNDAVLAKSNIYRREDERIMQKNREIFRKCYVDELKKDPFYREGIVLSWEIKSTGGIQNIAITNSTTNNPKVHVCILETLKTLKFIVAKDKLERTMIYPMILSDNNCEY